MPPHRSRHYRITGQVQGVGFRPFVYRIATELKLAGTVRNDPAGVTIVAAATPAQLDRFIERLYAELPPLARIDSCTAEPTNDSFAQNEKFTIIASDHAPAARGRVAVDSPTCPDCLAEMRDPTNRRYQHPLINCTNCGPRYSIIQDLPYDRPLTTMADFPMCDQCAREYRDPANRRFHAQPTCCPNCGPQLQLVGLNNPHAADERVPERIWRTKSPTSPAPTGEVSAQQAEGVPLPPSPITQAAQLLRSGRILALKGLGGYHLAADATNQAAVAELRRRKHRDHKPLAVMVADLAAARTLVRLSPEAERLMQSPICPIVLAQRRQSTPIAESVAPASHRLGIMLAYTPIHHLLFDLGLPPLVMTSANLSDDPLVTDDHEAITRLAHLCDAVLLHDRPIERAIDDSIVLDTPTAPTMLRRARGHVPEAIPLPSPAPAGEVSAQRAEGVPPSPPGLCLGADLKNTVAIVRQGEAVASEHIGDLNHTLAYQRFTQTIDDLGRLFDTSPEWIACDLHPAYLSTRFAKKHARDRNLPLYRIQHHHAHAAALMTEHARTDPVIALVCDGVGYGSDGQAWGGEILHADLTSFTRLGSLRPLRLPGGDAAAKEATRCALSWLHDLLGDAARTHPAAAQLMPDAARRTMIFDMLDRDLNCPPSTAAGRLFDAAAALLGLCDYNHHEAMSGMALESAAHSATTHPSGADLIPIKNPPSPVPTGEVSAQRTEGVFQLDHRPLLDRLLQALENKEPTPALAHLFHDALAAALAAAAAHAAHQTNTTTVALTGGVFCNELLTSLTRTHLEKHHLEALTHHNLSPNDGSIAIGQASIVLARTASMR